MAVVDITGKRFGRLTVLYRVQNDKHGTAVWMCKCDCGNIISVPTTILRSGRKKSCGCLRKERLGKYYNELNKYYNALKDIREILCYGRTFYDGYFDSEKLSRTDEAIKRINEVLND